MIDHSQFFHRLSVAVFALDKITDEEGMKPFSIELSVLRNIVSTAYGTEKELMETVISSIPHGLELEGVQSINELRRRFDFLAEEVRQSSSCIKGRRHGLAHDIYYTEQAHVQETWPHSRRRYRSPAGTRRILFERK